MFFIRNIRETTEHPKTLRVVRFGSKALNHWQKSYGPTKLELLGVVTSITDCSSYLSSHHFVVECDHAALRPLIQKQLKGAIYDRWLAILQQYNFQIRYKQAAQMQAPDALSRCMKSDATDCISSPDESDPYFPYVAEQAGIIDIIAVNSSGEQIKQEMQLNVHCQQNLRIICQYGGVDGRKI